MFCATKKVLKIIGRKGKRGMISLRKREEIEGKSCTKRKAAAKERGGRIPMGNWIGRIKRKRGRRKYGRVTFFGEPSFNERRAKKEGSEWLSGKGGAARDAAPSQNEKKKVEGPARCQSTIKLRKYSKKKIGQGDRGRVWMD